MDFVLVFLIQFSLITQVRLLQWPILLFFVLTASNTNAKQSISVTLESANNAPFEIGDSKKGIVSGFHVEMVEAVAEKLNAKIQWFPRPWTRAIESVKNGEVDAITYVTESDERKQFMLFLPDNLLHEDRICVVVRKNFKENNFNGTLESLYGEKVGLATQYLISKEILENKNKFKSFEQTVNGEQINEMLVAGRFDYTFSEPITFNNKFAAKFPSLQMLTPCISGEKRFIGFSTKKVGYKELAHKFEIAFRAWKKTPAYKKLLAKYEIPQ